MGVVAIAYGIWCILFISYCALLAYIALAARRVHNGDVPSKRVQDLSSASLLIPFHNEAQHILATVESLKRLRMPIAWEVLFIDDHSTDGTTELLHRKAKGLPYRVLQSPKRGKKHALLHGVRHARYDLIVATDADVQLERDWLVKIVTSHVKEQWVFGTGPVFTGRTGSWLCDFQYMEYLGLSLLTAAGIATGRWALANGANMAWKRSLIDALKPWDDNIDIPTGDDVFLARAVQRHIPDGTGYWWHAPVYTHAVESLKSLVAQRSRWASKLPLVSTRAFTIVLFIIGGIHWCCVWLPIYFFHVGGVSTWAIAALILSKAFADYGYLRHSARFFHQRWPGAAVFLRAWLVNALFHGVISPMLYFWSYVHIYRTRVTSP